MNLAGRTLALYGRFERDRAELARAAETHGATIAKNGTTPADVIVVGARSLSAQACTRIAAFAHEGAGILSEQRLSEFLDGEALETEATIPVAVASRGMLGLTDALVLAAFDLVRIDQERCRFGDAAVLRTAGELAASGRPMHEIVATLISLRTMRPLGPSRVVQGPEGKPALKWDSGQVTTVEGQGYLELGANAASPDELFAAALEAEEACDAAEAIRLYEICARADKRDAAAAFNLGNVLLRADLPKRAIIAFQQAIARRPSFAEAHYNLSVALERLGRTAAAKSALRAALRADPKFSDAIFNLAQLEMKDGALDLARSLYEQYLKANPPPPWAEKARKAIVYCAARLSA